MMKKEEIFQSLVRSITPQQLWSEGKFEDMAVPRERSMSIALDRNSGEGTYVGIGNGLRVLWGIGVVASCVLRIHGLRLRRSDHGGGCDCCGRAAHRRVDIDSPGSNPASPVEEAKGSTDRHEGDYDGNHQPREHDAKKDHVLIPIAIPAYAPAPRPQS